MRVNRRTALKTMACALAGISGLAASRAALARCPISSPRNLGFDIYRGSKNIGSHSIRFATKNGVLVAATHISITVKLAFITLLDLRHESEEHWESARLIRLDSTTHEDKETFKVQGEATEDGFRVRSEGGIENVGSGIMTTNTLWDPCILDQTEVIDAQHGGIVGIVVKHLGEEEIEAGKRRMRAMKSHFILPEASGDLWFTSERLVKASIEVRSEIVEYRLKGDEPETATG